MSDLSFDSFTFQVSNMCVRPQIIDSWSDKIKSLIAKCWDNDPEVRPDFSQIIERLQEIIIEEAILDPTGRSFWKRNYSSKDKIPWNHFISDFSKFMDLQNEKENDIYILSACLKELLADKQNNEESVSLDQFGKMLDYFGPIRRGGSKTQFFSNFKNILSRPWFHGGISTDETGSILNKSIPGTFLVRFSSSERGSFTISISLEDGGKIQHVRIKHPPLKDEFSININNTEKYSSLTDLIEQETVPLVLKEPCSGSKFTYIMSQPISEYM